MLNFREKLNGIIQERRECRNVFELYATDFLNDVLNYIRKYVSMKQFKQMEMLFARDKNNRVYVKVYVDDKQDKSAKIFVDTRSKDEAVTLLVFLEHQFRNEGYKLLPETSVFMYECFSVVITF